MVLVLLAKTVDVIATFDVYRVYNKVCIFMDFESNACKQDILIISTK